MVRSVVIAVLLVASAMAQTPAEQQLKSLNRKYQQQVVAKDYDGATASITQMLDLAAVGHVRVNRGQMLYARACFNALSGRKERAISDANAAVSAGFADYNAFANDPDLSSVRDAPEFQALLARLSAATSPADGLPRRAEPPAPPKPQPEPAPAVPSAENATPEPKSEQETDSHRGEEQAVIVHWRTATRDIKHVSALAEKLKAALAAGSAGEFDGVEFADRESTLYMKGADADRLFQAAVAVLKGSHPLRGSYVVKRYGNAGAKETRLAL